MEDRIIITMLGEFSITYRGKKIAEDDNRSKKIWRLLKYLITFRDKEISQNELIELLWPEEDIENPVNALKTALHRVRTLLKQLELPVDCSPIIQKQGSYGWNKDMDCCIDAMEFDTLCAKGNDNSLPIEDRLIYYQQAITHYKGDYLPSYSLDTWVVPINTYYHSLYLKVVRTTILFLEQYSKYNSIVEICLNAIKLDPYEEFLHYHLILSYNHLGQQQLAITQYDYITNLFYKQFGINPSEKLTSLYKEINKSQNQLEVDLGIIRDALKETMNTCQPYYCDFSVFKEIYRLEARAAVRSGNSIYISLLTVYSSGTNKPPKQSTLNNSMERLKQSILNCLRRGDVFARYSAAQYIIMLPTTSFENGERIMERIISKYRQEKPRIPSVNICYKLLPLEPSI